MSEGFTVDHAVLDRAADDLTTAAKRLDAVSESTPGSVDAGDATALISSILGRVLANAGQLADGAVLAAATLRSCAAEYRAADDRAHAAIRRQRGN